MSNRKFNLESSIAPEKPFRLLSISSSKYGTDWVSFPHSHHFTEIFFIKGGSGYMQIENNKIPIKPNSLIIIGAQVLHTEISNTDTPLDYYVLGVEGLRVNTNNENEYSILDVSANAPLIRQCFETILHEIQDKLAGYAEICQHYLSILILLICRKNMVSYEVALPQNSSRECHKAKQYIDDHYHDKITLDSLAETCNLTKYYLSHKFTELYGQSPMAYLNEVRIAAAKDLLKTTTYSIEEIAFATGFSSNSYFSQTFQKHCQMSPHKYRQSITA